MKTEKTIAKLANRIELWDVERLQPYSKNSRTHSDDQVAQIVASIKEFGFTNPILVDSKDGIIAGHGRLMAAKSMGLAQVPVIVLDHLTEEQRRAYVIADNKLALNAGWDDSILAEELKALEADGFDLSLTGFSDEELADLLPEVESTEPKTEDDAVPEVPVDPVTKPGDIWVLGNHRVMCGDSTSVDHVEKLMNGAKAQLVHADPPYGMGKASDGVANDNIYEEELDEFQMAWWATFRTFLVDNASAYIWGNAPDLWRLWYSGGLKKSERMTMRNQIVWKKNTAQGMNSEKYRSFPTATEHCLFFMFGQQEASKDKDGFFEAWEPVFNYLTGQRKLMGWTVDQVCEFLGKSTATHYFSKSQFQLPHKKSYEEIQRKAEGRAFKKSYKELEAEFNASKAYFDNTHETMTDVWEYGSVVGNERHGHATPKPVAMMERIMKSSLPKGGVCVEPFGGSGSTLIGAEKTGRVCYTMELQPKYVDVIVQRWQEYTGKKAMLETTGEPFDTFKKAA